MDLNYRIDNGPLKPVQSGMETLVAGEYTVDVFASDCSGNTDSCSYNLVVEDTVSPLPILVRLRWIFLLIQMLVLPLLICPFR